LGEWYDQNEEKTNSQQQNLPRFDERSRHAGVLMDGYPPRFPSENQTQQKNSSSSGIEAQEYAPEDKRRGGVSKASGVRHNNCRALKSWRRQWPLPWNVQDHVVSQTLSFIRQTQVKS